MRVSLFGSLAVAGGLALAVWLFLGANFTWLAMLTAWLVGVNVQAFALYGYDKWKARVRGRRVPEFVLHTLTAAGGGPGAYAGMRWFRHKTVKGSFRVVFWSLLALQVVLIAWLAVRYAQRASG